MVGSHGFAARGALLVQTRRRDERFDRIRSIESGAAPDLAAMDDYDEALAPQSARSVLFGS